MKAMSSNEMRAFLTLAKEYTTKYNARSLSRRMGLSAMGTLKILKRLEEEGLLVAETIGKAKIFRINYRNAYTGSLLAFLLKKEAEETPPRVKRWVTELRAVEREATIGVLFGSVLRTDAYKDIDLLALLEEEGAFDETIARINRRGRRPVHPMKQTKEDLERNLEQEERVVLSAVKEGIVIFGQETFVEVLARVAR